MKYDRLKAYHPNIDISNGTITNLKSFDVLFLDSNNELGIEPDDLRVIQENFPKLSTVSILKTTQTEQYLAKSDYEQLVQAKFKCEAGQCSVIKNRFEGECGYWDILRKL